LWAFLRLEESMFKTTLNRIRNCGPCQGGWTTLLKGLGKTKPDDEPLALTRILEINGLDDAIWCLNTMEKADREIRLFAVACARQVQHLMTDPRSLAALEVSERFAKGQATESELDVARATAVAAAADETWAASAAAAWAAARAAAWDANWAASAAATRAVEAAARAATRAVEAASWDAEDEAWAATWDAARADQAQLFRGFFGEACHSHSQ
jgi:hypothetical protein